MHLVYKVYKAVIHVHPLPSARLPMNIRLTSRYILPTSFIFRSVFTNFRKFCPFLERMKTDGATPEILLVRYVLYAYVLCPSASGTGPLEAITVIKGEERFWAQV